MRAQPIAKMAGTTLIVLSSVLYANAQSADTTSVKAAKHQKHKTPKDDDIMELPLRIAFWQNAQQTASLEQVLAINKKTDTAVNDNNTAYFHLSLIDENSGSIVDLVADRERSDAFSLRGHLQYHGSNGEKTGNPELPESDVHFTGTLTLAEMKKLLKSVVDQTQHRQDGINAETRHLLQLSTEIMPVEPSEIIPIPLML